MIDESNRSRRLARSRILTESEDRKSTCSMEVKPIELPPEKGERSVQKIAEELSACYLGQHPSLVFLS